MSVYKNLRTYVDLDDVVIDKKEENDFTRFCAEHCSDITNVCDCLDEILHYIDNFNDNDYEDYDKYKEVSYHLNEIKRIIKKIID